MLGCMSTDSATYHPRVASASAQSLLRSRCFSNSRTRRLGPKASPFRLSWPPLLYHYWTAPASETISPIRRSGRSSEYSLIGSRRGRPEQSQSTAQNRSPPQLIRNAFDHFAIADFVFTQMPRGLAISRWSWKGSPKNRIKRLFHRPRFPRSGSGLCPPCMHLPSPPCVTDRSGTPIKISDSDRKAKFNADYVDGKSRTFQVKDAN